MASTKVVCLRLKKGDLPVAYFPSMKAARQFCAKRDIKQYWTYYGTRTDHTVVRVAKLLAQFSYTPVNLEDGTVFKAIREAIAPLAEKDRFGLSW